MKKIETQKNINFKKLVKTKEKRIYKMHKLEKSEKQGKENFLKNQKNQVFFGMFRTKT